VDPAAARSLHELLSDRLFADESLDDATRELVLAAFDGDGAFDAELRGRRSGAGPGPGDSGPAPGRRAVHLRSITVEGFRGIAGRQRLDLSPGPGLTVVTGRNGSGKSSFAEAAETALTGRNERWRGRSAEWAKGFRNVHHTGPVRVAVELAEENGPGTRTITRTWTGEDHADSTATSCRRGHPQQRYEPGEWGDLLETYRPFLPYSELGKLISGRPTDLHDGVLALLGMERLTAAQQRLSAAESAFNERLRTLDEQRRELIEQCREAGDERAERCAELLSAPRPDLDALADLALHDGTEDGRRAALQAVAGLRAPDEQRVQRAAERLLAAVTEVDRLQTDEADAARSVAGLLRAGIAHHARHGDGPCPLCGQGRVDGGWVAEAERSADAHDTLAAALRAAEAEQAAAIREAHELIAPVPDELDAPQLGLPVEPVREAWRRFAACTRASADELAFELPARRDDLATELAALRAAAAADLARADEIWRPLARRVGTWHDRALELDRDRDRRCATTAAKRWLKAAAEDLRNERLRPFAEQSQQIWDGLRQRSNISLDGLSLTGSANRRRLHLDVTVDGQRSAAMSVMSQGELHALGLSLFLPRATTAESPFRFVVVDDPVQAMDPAKVDGLARVLATVAEHRQVVVFTHDDRLTEAVRRLRLPATVLEVCRRERSQVQLRQVADPVGRYLDDAAALTKDDRLPDDVRGELVVGLCRSALEAAAHRKVRERRLGRGARHEEVEDLLARARTTHQRLALAVLDEPGRDGDLYRRLRAAGPHAVEVVRSCKSGAHGGFTGDLGELVHGVQRLTSWVGGLR